MSIWFYTSVWLWLILSLFMAKIYLNDTEDSRVIQSTIIITLIGPFLLSFLIIKTCITGTKK